jgi:hypothetical protein
MIHFAPTNISQTATVATVSTMMAASKAIERRACVYRKPYPSLLSEESAKLAR